MMTEPGLAETRLLAEQPASLVATRSKFGPFSFLTTTLESGLYIRGVEVGPITMCRSLERSRQLAAAHLTFPFVGYEPSHNLCRD